MSGSDMVVLWSNSDGTITLSQRTGTGHVMPTVDSSPSRVASLQQSASDVRSSPFHPNGAESNKLVSPILGDSFSAKVCIHSAR